MWSSSGASTSATRAGTSASCTNSGATSRPATTFTRPMYGMRTSRLAAAYVMRARPVRDDQRTPRDGRLERRRAALAHRGVGGAQHGERRGAHERIRAPLVGSIVDVRRGTHDHLERRVAALQLARRLHERIEVARDLLRLGSRETARAAGRAAPTPSVRRASARGRAASRARSSSGCPTNVASMPCSRSSASSNGRITAAFVTVRASSVQPLGAPRPHLRRDVVEHRHARGARRGGDLHVEAGIVDQHHERDAPARDAPAQLTQQPVVQRARA